MCKVLFFLVPTWFGKKNAPGGTRTPDPGLLRPMLYQTELPEQMRAHARDRTKDLQIFSLTLSQLSYMGVQSANYQEISVKLGLQLKNKLL